MEERHKTERKWQLAIGRFLLSFGKIEWFTYHLLVLLPTERIFGSVKSLRLSQRIRLIKDLLESKRIKKEVKENICTLLDEAEPLLEFRNTIAHNPLFIGFYDTEEGLGFRQQISKFTSIEKAITIEELENNCEKIEKLANRAYACESEIRRLLGKSEKSG
ncbi:MAG: hypothetical protein V3S24_08700 [Candidatus Tectomicrobia bacterium]